MRQHHPTNYPHLLQVSSNKISDSQSYRSAPRSRKWPMPGSLCFTASSTSPTCRLSEISSWCGLFSRLCKIYLNPIVNPRDLASESLMTADCYCKGSDELDSLLRCKYTSVPYLLRGEGSSLAIKSLFLITIYPPSGPDGTLGGTYPSMLISFRSPPKYRAYSLDMGSP